MIEVRCVARRFVYLVKRIFVKFECFDQFINMQIYNKNKYSEMQSQEWEVIKENVYSIGVVSLRWLSAATLGTVLTLLVATLVDRRLPEPLDRSAPSTRFIGHIAHEHLFNLTSIGPRVAGSYENEVVAVRVLVEAVRVIAAQASPHNRVDFDVFAASGAFSLTFLDGMSNIYRDVQSVVVRARGAGGRGHTARSALLLNCHFDTVPDSPGASDDGAGCAVALETLRALVSGPPLRHDVLLLLNGAEENILQASHAFVTQHPWSRSVRAFINIEACGAGGREVLFQAGPHDPWIMEVYAGEVPHPFASSLAQELFESGLIPADTDFRIFRDYGNLSGVDLAWSSNGFVYHTRLDTAERVPPAVLQRTGDNVLALATGLLSSPQLEATMEMERQPVFFDVLGMVVVAARAQAALLALVVVLLALATALLLSARDAARGLYIPIRAWGSVLARAVLGVVLSSLAGVAAALVPALLLHSMGARLAFYSRAWLLIPLYSVPALVAAWADARHTWGTWLGRGSATLARGWWAWRAWRDALALCSGCLAALGGAAGVRSAFLPLLWTLPLLATLPARALRHRPPHAAALHAAAAALPAMQSAYLALNSVGMFVPIMGRAGTTPLPADVIMSVVVSILTLVTFSWMLPLVVAAKNPKPLMYAGLAACTLSCILVIFGPFRAPYSTERPQRLMLFHTRRSLPDAQPELFYWIPELDGNTPHSVDEYVAGMSTAEVTRRAECTRWVYCGAPYFLPVLSLVSRGHRLPAETPPHSVLQLKADLTHGDAPLQRVLTVNVSGPSHIVAILSPIEGAHISWCDLLDAAPQPGPLWGRRLTYFVAMHHARPPRAFRWTLVCHVQHTVLEPGPWLQLSIAGHAMAGSAQRTEKHASLLNSLPEWTAPTGWGVDLHVLEL